LGLSARGNATNITYPLTTFYNKQIQRMQTAAPLIKVQLGGHMATCFRESYNKYDDILAKARHQVSEGKGKERHGTSAPFEDQLICTIPRHIKDSPVAGPLFQVIKKAFESARLKPDAAIHELYGVINYSVACIILLLEEDVEKNKKT